MYEISFNFFVLMYLSLNKIFFPKYKSNYYLQMESNEKLERSKKKQIYFECGGGYVNYYGGIIKFIKENYSKEDLDKIIWMGSSAGTFPAIVGAYLEQNDSKEMLLLVQSKLDHLWFGAIYKINTFIKENIYEKYLLKYQEEICKNNKLFIAVLNINILCPIFSSITFYYNFENMKEFSDSCLTSHGIPFITGPLNVTIISHPKKWYIKRMDAGVFTVLFGFLFGYDKFMPYGKNIEYHVITPNIFRNIRLDWLWLWCCTKHTEMLFNLGYQDAKKNVDILNKMIL
jgi:hypothetical protein